MKKCFFQNYTAAILVLMSALILVSCGKDVDPDADGGPKKIVNKPLVNISLPGNYKVTGTIYNYTGSAPAWPGPPTPVPPGYVSTVDLSIYSPKTAVAINSTSAAIDFADQISQGRRYILTNIVDSPWVSVSFNQQFLDNVSNVVIPFRTITYPLQVTPSKPVIHFITLYQSAPSGLGHGRIVDETLEKL